MKIWVVLQETNEGHQSDVLGAYSSEEKARDARAEINREAIAAGESCYMDPDDPDYDDEDWNYDFTIEGPFELDAAAKSGFEPENVPCEKCGRTDLPLHINMRCGECGIEEDPKTTTCFHCHKDFPDADMMPLHDEGELCPKCWDRFDPPDPRDDHIAARTNEAIVKMDKP